MGIFRLGGRRNWWFREWVVWKNISVRNNYSVWKIKKYINVIKFREEEVLRKEFVVGCIEKRLEDVIVRKLLFVRLLYGIKDRSLIVGC